MTEPLVCQYHVEVRTGYACPRECKRATSGRGSGQLCAGQGTCGYNQNLQRALCICDEGFVGADCSETVTCGDLDHCSGAVAGSVLGTTAAQ